jgi:hypothetical protein
MSRVTLAAYVAVLLPLPWQAGRADDAKVPLEKLPKAAADAVKKRFPKAEIVSASKDLDIERLAEVDLYQIRLKDGGQAVNVSFTVGFGITRIGREVPAKDLPKDVSEAIKKGYPKATIKKAEEVSKGKDLVETAYEVLLVTKGKKTVEVVFDPKGKVLKTEEEKEGKRGETDKKDERDKKDR